ncbi:MAG: hypothetical protein WC579_01645 [Candidatus Paceibacterota bacterium]
MAQMAQMAHIKKRKMLEALEKSFGVVTTACNSSNIPRKTHYNWLKTDEKYRQAVEEINEGAIDFVESQLYKLVENGNVTAIIFFLKTRGKKRGYVEYDFDTEPPYEKTEFLNETEN